MEDEVAYYSAVSSDHEEDPYSEIGLNSVASGMPIDGYVEYNYEVGRKGRGPGQFGGWIQHFTVSHDGKTLYACDVFNKRIQLIDLANRKPIHAFPSNMAGFKFQARGISVLRNGNLCINCVGFDGTSRIGIFTPEGRVVSNFGQGTIGSSCAMTVDSMDRITVMDRRRMQITTCSRDGKILGTFHPQIQGDVLRLGSDNRGRIIVPNHLDNSVIVFEPNGRAVYKIKPAYGSGHSFKYPGAVACDADDNILVCDVGNHKVTQFSSEGVFRTTLLSQKQHGLWRPHDIVATPQGNVLLSEVSQTYIKIFCFSARRY
ncbi:E3 ubiquitin-protein ligase TRIM32-like isoform X2 [Clavelina lepadiformis]|uniref:E3 ubiquitin-protein ligase TRIM32-like isoform X2 n=1 Tax=Clavelina lepadiformis TaxID=159417 RepID=UPI004043233C